MLNVITGIAIGIGAVIDESIMNNYIRKKHCAEARKLLVIQWVFIGFLLTISYKSVLLANMMSVEYEKGIDTIDDMINSKKPLMVIRSMEPAFVTDPRPKVIELSKQVQYYDFDIQVNSWRRLGRLAKVPQWILNGQALYRVMTYNVTQEMG